MFAYTPTPAILPASIQLPQDVIDDVVVETVNPQVQICLDTLAALDVWQQGGTITANDNVTVDMAPGKTLTVAGNLACAGTLSSAFLQVAGTSLFTGDVATGPSSLLTANGGAELFGDVTIETLAGPMVLGAGGKIVERTLLLATQGDQTIQGALYDTIFIEDGFLTSDIDITIGDVGAIDGMKVTVVTQDNSKGVVVRGPAGNSLSSILVVGTNSSTAIVVQRIAGAWRRLYQARQAYT